MLRYGQQERASQMLPSGAAQRRNSAGFREAALSVRTAIPQTNADPQRRPADEHDTGSAVKLTRGRGEFGRSAMATRRTAPTASLMRGFAGALAEFLVVSSLHWSKLQGG